MSGSIGTTGKPAPQAYTNVGGVGPTGLGSPLQMDSSGNVKIAGSITASNPSVGVNGAAAPTSSTEIGIIVSGLLQGVSASNPVPISGTFALPVGASTSALQTTGNSSLSSIVSNQTNGTQVTTIAGSVPLPTGAATSALQSTTISTLGSPFQAGGSIGNTAFGISGSLPAGANAIGSISVSNFPTTQPVSGSVSVSNFPATQPISATSLPLATGAATAANQSTEITALGTINTTLGSPLQAGGTVSVIAGKGTLTDGSGSTSGTSSTSTQIFAANASRKYLLIQNLGASAIYINFTSAASVTNSIMLAANGGSFVMESTYVSTEAVNVLSTGTSIAFMAKQG